MATKRKRGRPSLSTKTNREDLLKAALKAFALSGFEGTNVKQLGAKAGIAPSLFYYHFDDKIGLWKAALKLEAQQLEQAMESVELSNPSNDIIGFLKNWISTFIHFSAKHPEFHQVISYEMAHPSDRAVQLRAKQQNRHCVIKRNMAILSQDQPLHEPIRSNSGCLFLGVSRLDCHGLFE